MAQTETERTFLALGEGAEVWLKTAAATGVARIRAKMTRATELAALFGASQVDQALRRAAAAGSFEDGDLASILAHLDPEQPWPRGQRAVLRPTGTKAWAALGR